MSNVQKLPSATGASLTAYLENRKLITRARERAAAIADKLQEAQEAQARAIATSDESAKLRRESEDLAALVAVGHATPKEAEIRRAEIAKREAALAKGLAEARALDETVAGLDRLIERTDAEIGSLEDRGGELLAQLLRDDGERVGQEYVRACLVVKTSYLRLHALDALLREATHGADRIRRHDAPRLFLPGINIADCPADTADGMGVIFSEERAAYSGELRQAIETERARRRDSGVEV